MYNRGMDFFRKLKEKIETILPMTLGSLLLFGVILYLLFVVGKTVFNNYHSNQEILVQEMKLVELEEEIRYLENQINYYQTYSFKEKEAREKLGYKAPGEQVMALPIDTIEEKSADSAYRDQQVKEPNPRLWWKYFFQ